MKIRYFLGSIIFLTMALIFTGFVLQGCSKNDNHQHSKQDSYYCPMHPQVTSDRKGSCPICGMDLIKKETSANENPAVDKKAARKLLFYRNPMDPSITSSVPMKDSMGMDYVPVYEEPAGTSKGVLIDTRKQQLIGVKKDIVKIRPLAVEISTVGKVAYDPELFVAQEEYLQAVKMAAATEKSVLIAIHDQSMGLVTSAERKLLLLGMSKTEIAALYRNGIAQEGLYYPVNSGKAWIYITIYEYEMGLVKEGQDVVVDAVAYPGDIFKGKIIALTPILNAESRTFSVRAEVDDKEGKLKPEMYVNAKIAIDLGEKISVVQEAVMDSGTRKVVYVVCDDRFAAREVILGPKAGEFYEVLSGLTVGEEIVTSGNFLIDAESKLKGAL